ncbi:MAG: DUF2520 domain-containing protein [Eggerthellaceae bacterium]
MLDGADVGRAHARHPLLALSDPLPATRSNGRTSPEGDASAVPPCKRSSAAWATSSTSSTPRTGATMPPPCSRATSCWPRWPRRLMESCGFDAPAAREALEPLVMGNARAFCEKGAAAALTGPVERNDLPTAQRHLDDLDDEAAEMYRMLAKTLVSLAEEKHPDRDYADWNPFVEGKVNR